MQTITLSMKGNPMQRITVGRYKPFDTVDDPTDAALERFGAAITAIDVSTVFDGWIEGVRDDGSSWIMWLDALGNPMVFFGQRDENGGVEGDPVILSPGHPYFEDVD